jgi:hypothetical protein
MDYNIVKLNAGLTFKKQHSTRRLFSPAFVLEFKDEISKVLYLEHSFVWCWNLNTRESRPISQVPGQF